MTKEEREVMRIALEALESCGWNDGYAGKTQYFHDGLVDKAITAIEKCLANDALEKKAENARELGLDYEPNDGLCQACDGDSCTAKKGCVAISNPLQPEKERPSFAEWTSDYVQDNLHKLKPEQEHVSIPDCGEAGHADGACGNRQCLPSFRRNTTPPQLKPLTRQQCLHLDVHPLMTIEQVARVVEAAHGIKEKNT